MDDAVHVEIEVVELRLDAGADGLVDERIALAQPSAYVHMRWQREPERMHVEEQVSPRAGKLKRYPERARSPFQTWSEPCAQPQTYR